MSQKRFVMTPFWLCLWSIVLAVGWLLPNHYQPWLSFHTDAWMGLAFSMASVAVILRTRGPVMWHRITLLVALLPCIVTIQYVLGIVPMAGNAWISFIYLFGLLLAILTGAHWEANNAGQFINALFLAIGIAALLSVGLQLHTWLGRDGLGLLSMGGRLERPHANFGQPNQLATFLLWGLLAVAWGWLHKRIGVWTALLISFYLLFGIALTASRTAWIGVSLLVCLSWFWRGLWRDARLPWVVTGLGIYFVLCVVYAGWLQSLLQVSGAGIGRAAIANVVQMNAKGDPRQLAWTAFADALSQHPLWGFGWNQSGLAQMSVASEHPQIGKFFSYSHNLFFDLVLWCGIPLGLLISLALLWWLWKRFSAVRNAENAVLLLFVLIVANHAMFELPLYFAYFLLPVGMMIGVLNVRLGAKPVMYTSRGFFFALWLATTILLSLIIRDYLRVETSYRILRMEWYNFKMSAVHAPPDVLLLTQWQEYIRYARFVPIGGLTNEELNWMRHVTGLYPNMIFFNKIATAMALNHRPDEAALWLKRLCKIAPEEECLLVKKDWARQSLKEPAIAAVPWPLIDKK
jgi:O-antigen ligase